MSAPTLDSAVVEECDHDWLYDGGDQSVGINGAWVCQKCGAEDCESEPPSEEDYL